MSQMLIKTLTISVAMVLVVTMIVVPSGGIAQAASGGDSYMMHDDGGSAHFDPDQLPDPFERDFDGECVWWKYELQNGRYVRTYCPCQFGEQEEDYSIDYRLAFQASVEAKAAQADADVMEEPAEESDIEEAEAVAVEETALEEAVVEEAVVEEAEAEESAGDAVDAEAEATEEPAEVEDEEVETEAAEVPDAEATDVEAVAEVEAAVEEAVAEEAAVEEAVAEEAVAEEAVADIVDTADAASEFATLLAAAGATGIDEILRNEGPYTVFAPNDEAFAAIFAGSELEDMLESEPDQVAELLRYHVVEGSYTSDMLVDGMELPTLQGGIITITSDGDSTIANDANIIAADIIASNGVIHVIDAVLDSATE